MSVEIGSVELPIIFAFDETKEAEVDEIRDPFKYSENVPVKHSARPSRFVITGYVNEIEHSKGKALEQQKKDLKQLRMKSVTDNSFEWKEYKGHLLIESINFTDSGDNRIVNEVEIDGRYLPWPKFYPDEL